LGEAFFSGGIMRGTDQSQRGASVVEFAIIAPLFIAVLFAIVEFGLVIYTKSMITHATREGARFGVVYCTPRRTDAEIRAIVQNYLDTCALTNPATVTVTGAGGAPGADLTVQVDYTYRFYVVPKDISNITLGKMANISLRARTVMRME
jgi:Flp pilus assembly protein TadG